DGPGGSRTEIGALMPFTLQSMTNITQELIDLGLVVEFDRPNEGRRGNPPKGLRVAAGRAHSLGVQMRWDSCEIALVDLQLNMADSLREVIPAAIDDSEGYLRSLVQAFGRTIQAQSGKEIWSIGLSGPLPITAPNMTSP